MSAMTTTRLRRVPLPVSEPRAALHLIRPNQIRPGEPTIGVPVQQCLTLAEGSAPESTPAGRRSPRSPVPAPFGLPDPYRWTAQFVQAAVEVTLAVRPAAQLMRWTSEEVYAGLSKHAALAAKAPDRRPGLARVSSVHVSSPVPGTIEACAVVSDGRRLRAVALRLEEVRSRWLVTALRLG